jgi:two-component system chemotaxis response regulator CheB
VLIEKDRTLSLDDSEKVNFSRHSIDVTFDSASEVYGQALACVLLSGANADGVEGLKLAKHRGSLVLVQDPACAEVPFMPQQAIDNVAIDMILTPQNLNETLAQFLK